MYIYIYSYVTMYVLGLEGFIVEDSGFGSTRCMPPGSCSSQSSADWPSMQQCRS